VSERRPWELRGRDLLRGLMTVYSGHCSKQKVSQPCFGQWDFSCLSTIGDILVGLEMGAVGQLGVLHGQSESWGSEESLGGSTTARREDGESEPIAIQNFLALALLSGFVKSRPGCMHAQFAAHFPKKGI